MNAVIIDDKKKLRQLLKMLLKTYTPEVNVVGEADGVDSGIKLIHSLKVDLVFLDVEMQDGTGFDLLAYFPSAKFQVIFVTAHDHYALKAIKFNALDYLLKPVAHDELITAVNRAEKKMAKLAQDQENLRIPQLLSDESIKVEKKKIVLTDSENIHLVDKSEIIRCQSEGNYTHFYMSNNRSILVSKTLKEYIRDLDDHNFVRVHHSHLINLEYFSHYEKANGGVVHLKDGSSLPVAVRRKEVLLQALNRM